MADKFRTPWGQIVERGPELIKALRSRYTVRYYANRLDEFEDPFVIFGQEYSAGETLRAVDPEQFNQFYENELEYITEGQHDDILADIFGFVRVDGGSSNAKPKKRAPGKSGSRNLIPKSSNRKPPAKKNTKATPRRRRL